MSILEMLSKELEEQLDILSKQGADSEEYRNILRNISELHKSYEVALKIQEEEFDRNRKNELEEKKIVKELELKKEDIDFQHQKALEDLRLKEMEIERQLELRKLEIENQKLKNEKDIRLKEKEFQMQKKIEEENLSRERLNMYAKWCLEGAAVILPLIFYGVWMSKGFRFEEEGTFTSTTFRGLFGKFSPKKF